MNPLARRGWIKASAGLALAPGFVSSTAVAQSSAPTYPTKPIRVVVPFTAGSTTDIIARAITDKLAASMGQPFVVDNRAGDSGRIGVPVVAKAAPDGYTIMVSPASFLTTNKSIFKTLPYNLETDFIPVTKLVDQTLAGRFNTTTAPK